MRNQLTVNAAIAAGFKVVGWELVEKVNDELLYVEDSRGTGRYFDPLNVSEHAFELQMILSISVTIEPSQDRIRVFTDDFNRVGYYVSVDTDPALTNKRKAHVTRELITMIAADYP